MGTWQILLFALIAVKIKANAPGAHTFPEIVLARHGRLAHATYLFFGWATNMLVGACLVLGGSQVVGALSGVNVYAACFLIPLVVGAYVIAGGLRSTFIADYTHTVILFVAIFVFGFTLYCTSDVVGSPSRFYELLQEASAKMPIAGNRDGSYLTMKSNGGLVFAIDLLVAGFSTVWLDQAYWQRAIASQPDTSVKAYLFGGIAWYGIPFGFATAMGLGCAALTGTPTFPTYPDPLSEAQNGAGLSSPATAIALLGSGGAGLMLLLLFMAVTSSTSAELIAVSSLITFDIYKTYMRPNATSHELVRVSHLGIIIYGLVLGAFCCGLNAGNANLTWLLTVLGVIVGGASIPVGLVLLWSRMSTAATLAAPWLGFGGGLIAWFVVTSKRSGEISVLTTGDVTNAVAGNITSWALGGLSAFILSILFPRKFASTDQEAIKRNAKIDGTVSVLEGETITSSPSGSEEKSQDPEQGGQRAAQEPSSSATPDTVVPTGNDMVDFLESKHVRPLDPEEYRKANRLAVGFNYLFFFVAIILVPFALFGTEWIFTEGGFTGWIVISFLWVWCSMCICVIWPVVESWSTIWRICKGMVKDVATSGDGKALAKDTAAEREVEQATP